MDLLHTARFDVFVIVSGDSDFTPLAIRLRESGSRVVVFGKTGTPGAFRSACDEFIEIGESTKPEPKAVVPADEFSEIHKRIKDAWEDSKNEQGFANVGAGGSKIKCETLKTLSGGKFGNFTKFLKNFPALSIS